MLLKKPIYILLVLNLFFILSCKKDAEVPDLLTKAEALMEHSPDSARAILQYIEAPEKLSEKQYALWCLLFTQAEDKKYIYHTSDSLIKVAIGYFETTDEDVHLMKSYYYAAVVYHDIGDFPRAQEFYLKALDSAEKLEDHAFLGRIYSNLGIIYIDLDIDTEALKFQKKALDKFTLVNDSINTGIVLRNMGWMYAELGQPDSAIIYYTKAISFVDLNDHPYILNEIGSLYKLIGNYQEAFTYARSAQDVSSPNSDLTSVYHNIGSLYRLTDKLDSAMFYLTQCTLSVNPYTKMEAYLNLAYLEKQNKNWQTCIEYQQQYIQLKDSLNQVNQSSKLQRIQSFFNYQQIEKERYFHEQDANNKKVIYIPVTNCTYFYTDIAFYCNIKSPTIETTGL